MTDENNSNKRRNYQETHYSSKKITCEKESEMSTETCLSCHSGTKSLDPSGKIETSPKGLDESRFDEREFQQECGPPHSFQKAADNQVTLKLRVAILGYKNSLVGQWDPSSTENGLPGSEEAVVYASEQLVEKGCDVKIYMNPPINSSWRLPDANPQWYDEDYYYDEHNKQQYDLILLWRRIDVMTGRRRAKKVFFWPHDSPALPHENAIFPRFDGVLMLTEYHRRQYGYIWRDFNKIPYIISGNGIVPQQFNKPMNIINPYSIGYFSNYSRGLIILLLIWPEIKKNFPQATLHICYGRQTWNTMSPELFQLVVDKIQQYKDFGVIEHGQIGHIALANLMQQTSVLAYPCTANSETFCITLVKCQMAGMIPVITRIAALNETGHPECPSIISINNNLDINLYKNLLLQTLHQIKNSSPDSLTAQRLKYRKFASQFSWENCVTKWLQLYHSS